MCFSSWRKRHWPCSLAAAHTSAVTGTWRLWPRRATSHKTWKNRWLRWWRKLDICDYLWLFDCLPGSFFSQRFVFLHPSFFGWLMFKSLAPLAPRLELSAWWVLLVLWTNVHSRHLRRATEHSLSIPKRNFGIELWKTVFWSRSWYMLVFLQRATLQPWHGKSLVEGAATLAFQKYLKCKQQSAHWNKLRTSMTYVANVSLDWISTLHQIFKHPQIKIGEIKVEANWNLLARDDRMWNSRAKRRIRILRPASQSSLAKWTPRKPMAFTRLTLEIQLQWFKVTHWWRQSHAPRHLGSTKSQEGLQGACFSRKMPCLNFLCTAMPRRDSAQPLHRWVGWGSVDQVRYGSTESSERCFRVNGIGNLNSPPGSRKHRPPSLSKELSNMQIWSTRLAWSTQTSEIQKIGLDWERGDIPQQGLQQASNT